MTFILEDQPSKIRSCPIKARVIWVPGIFIYVYIYIYIYINSLTAVAC